MAPLHVDVCLPAEPYRVLIGPGLLRQSGERIAALALGQRCALLTDETVEALYAEPVLTSLRDAGIEAECFSVPAGEPSKSLESAGDLCRRMIRAGHDRQSFVVALGGGVVGDLAGFVAGIFYRGVPFVQIATTVLAQVDSSVGGKTGVNAPEGKNLIGVFHQPRLVLADTDTLDSLPPRIFSEGFAEIIKHAAIRDAGMIPLIRRVLDGERELLPELVARNVRIKAAIVVEDEKEISGTRALLNFGHTVGHAVEAAGGYGRFLHGEAISLGLVAAARLSALKSGLSGEDAAFLEEMLADLELPTRLPEDLATEDILACARKDKKFAGGKVRFVLLRTMGEAFVSEDVSPADMAAAIEGLR